jgi:lipopolysaccharide transport system ATP-binding protein
MSNTVISVENLSKTYRLGQIGTGTFTYDLALWWAKMRGRPNPLLRIGERDHGNREGESIWALRDVNFEVEQGEVLGIIGRNGAGKSTLLKILSRVTAPTDGKIKVNGRIASLLEVGTGFHPDLTGRENIYLNGAILGMSRNEIKSKFDEIVGFAEVDKFIDTPVKRYSSGMYVRLAFAVAAHLEPEILVVDEVLAVGDADFQKKCLGKMGDVAKQGRTVLFVSHNMASIENLCRKGILLDHGYLNYSGNVSDTVDIYKRNLMVDLASERGNESHVLYQSADHTQRSAFSIRRIEVFEDDEPAQAIFTWSKLTFRIHYFAEYSVRMGAVVLRVSSLNNETLLLLSTRPGLNVPMEIQTGEHCVDCVLLDKLPLSAGEYVLGCGLGIPNKEWLCWNDRLVSFTVQPKDVYESGLPPVSNTTLIAIPYGWRFY